MNINHDIIETCLRTEYGPKVPQNINNAWFINISAREEIEKIFIHTTNRLRYIDTTSKMLVDEDRLILKVIAYCTTYTE